MSQPDEQLDGTEVVEPRPFRPIEAIVALGGIQALTMLAGLVRTKLLALLLGPALLGVVGVIDQIVALVTHAGSLSTPFAAMKFLSRRIGQGMDRVRAMFTGLFRLMLGASLGLTVGAGVVAFLRPELLSAELGPYRLPLLLALASAPALTALGLLRNVLAALGKHREAAVAAFIGAVGLIASAYLGIELGGVPGLYAGNLVVNILLVGVVFGFLSRSSGVTLLRGPGIARAAVREDGDLAWYLSFFHLLTLVTPLAYLVARVAVLDHHGDVAAGLYYAAYGLAVAVRVVLHQANALYLSPIVNRPTPPAERVAATADYLRVLSVLTTLGALPLVLFPDLWIWLLYSADFTDAARFLTPFVVGEMILLFAAVLLSLLIGFDDLRGHLTIAVVGHLVILVLAFWLTPPFGPVGVAYAFIAGNSLMLVAAILRLRTTYRGPLFLAPLGGLALALVVLASAGWWATGSGLEPGFIWKGPVYLVIALCALIFLNPGERRWLVAPWRRP